MCAVRPTAAAILLLAVLRHQHADAQVKSCSLTCETPKSQPFVTDADVATTLEHVISSMRLHVQAAALRWIWLATLACRLEIDMSRVLNSRWVRQDGTMSR